MADPKKYISIINNGTDALYIKDAEAQQAILELQKSVTGAMHFLGASSTAIADGDSTGPWVIDGVTYVASGATGEQVNLKAGDAVIYGAKEFVWSGASGSWKEYGDMSSLKSLAYKDASDIETAGSTSQKLVTTSITGVSGSTTVTGVDGSTTVTGVDGSTSVYGCGENTTVHDTPSLGTTDIYGCGENTTVHDTPSLGTTDIYGCGTDATVGSASSWNDGALPSLSYDGTTETLTFSAGTKPSLTITDTTVATKASSATAVGTSIVAGTEVTVATKAASATAVGTSIVAGTEVTVATKASSATTVPVAAASATTVPVAAASATTVPTAAGSATTVATGAVAAADENGASVVTAVSTTIQNKATV